MATLFSRDKTVQYTKVMVKLGCEFTQQYNFGKVGPEIEFSFIFTVYCRFFIAYKCRH